MNAGHFDWPELLAGIRGFPSSRSDDRAADHIPHSSGPGVPARGGLVHTGDAAPRSTRLTSINAPSPVTEQSPAHSVVTGRGSPHRPRSRGYRPESPADARPGKQRRRYTADPRGRSTRRLLRRRPRPRDADRRTPDAGSPPTISIPHRTPPRRQKWLRYPPLLVRKVPSPHTKMITAQGKERSRLPKHAPATVGSGQRTNTPGQVALPRRPRVLGQAAGRPSRRCGVRPDRLSSSCRAVPSSAQARSLSRSTQWTPCRSPQALASRVNRPLVTTTATSAR